MNCSEVDLVHGLVAIIGWVVLAQADRLVARLARLQTVVATAFRVLHNLGAVHLAVLAVYLAVVTLITLHFVLLRCACYVRPRARLPAPRPHVLLVLPELICC